MVSPAALGALAWSEAELVVHVGTSQEKSRPSFLDTIDWLLSSLPFPPHKRFSFLSLVSLTCSPLFSIL